MYHADVDVASLFGRVGQRLVCGEGLAKAVYILTLGLAGNLLAGSLSLQRQLRVMLGIGRQRGGSGGVEGRVGSVARESGTDWCCVLVRRVGLGADVLNVVSGVVTGSGLIITSPLPRRLAGGRVVGNDGRVRVGDLAANVGLGLRGIIYDNDLLGETIAVETIPVGFPGTATLSRRGGIGLVGGRHGSGHVFIDVALVVGMSLMAFGRSLVERGMCWRSLGLGRLGYCVSRRRVARVDRLVKGQQARGSGRQRRGRGLIRRRRSVHRRGRGRGCGSGGWAIIGVAGWLATLVVRIGRMIVVRMVVSKRGHGRRGRRHGRSAARTWKPQSSWSDVF